MFWTIYLTVFMLLGLGLTIFAGVCGWKNDTTKVGKFFTALAYMLNIAVAYAIVAGMIFAAPYLIWTDSTKGTNGCNRERDLVNNYRQTEMSDFCKENYRQSNTPIPKSHTLEEVCFVQKSQAAEYLISDECVTYLTGRGTE